MLDVYSEYATDENAEVTGVWHTLKGKTRLLLGRMGNVAYSKMLNKLYTENREALEREDDAADVLDREIMVKVYARTILLGWEEVGMKGQALPYTTENAETLLRIKDFRQDVFKLSSKMDAYRVKQETEQGKA